MSHLTADMLQLCAWQRFHKAALGVAVLLLSACQTGTAIDDGIPVAASSQAMEAHRVQDSVAAFSEICLARSLSVSVADEATQRFDMGITAPTRLRRTGRPTISISARIQGDAVTDREAAFDEYNCVISFRGTWADVVADHVSRAAQQAGYQFIEPLTRQTLTSSVGTNAVLYVGAVERSGNRSALTVSHREGGRGNRGDVRILYVSGTVIAIEGLSP